MDQTINAIENDFIPDIAHVEGVHVLTVIIGIIAIIMYAWGALNTRKNKIKTSI